MKGDLCSLISCLKLGKCSTYFFYSSWSSLTHVRKLYSYIYYLLDRQCLIYVDFTSVGGNGAMDSTLYTSKSASKGWIATGHMALSPCEIHVIFTNLTLNQHGFPMLCLLGTWLTLASHHSPVALMLTE